ncbi:MAG TPA: 5-methyltetrahydropteroyltriglutamate--homocysteine S-methyltransferase [Candidatus Limnocylindria bacterium]|jgi:5-methyltetrahydropteroyltriglutamate--homocysteine methyltransferase|nr:5-methyltetrahydropteroyltriglutamate--homocysteine S-methyltransferase [Candidatus Limnocylindria bacterium]
MEKIHTQNLGYPRIGERRELKRATEAYWKGGKTEAELLAEAKSLRSQAWLRQKEAGIDVLPSNDFSLYDHMLDTCALVGAIPPRFGWKGGPVDLELYFRMARGSARESHGVRECGCASTTALEMTKWFDTNYHYLVPEFEPETKFNISSEKPFAEFAEALSLGLKTKPVLVGPVTFLRLGKAPGFPEFSPLTLLPRLLAVYGEVLRRLASQGADWVQFDEPVLALDMEPAERHALIMAYRALGAAAPGLRLQVASYFGELRENLDTFAALPVAGLHFDAVRGVREVPMLVEKLPADKVLSLGVVDGRNIWRNDYTRSLKLLRPVLARIGPARLWVAPSCSLLHSPVTLRNEPGLDPELKSWLAFADEKLTEVVQLAGTLDGSATLEANEYNQRVVASRRTSGRIHNPAVKRRVNSVQDKDFKRPSVFLERQARQRERLHLPEFPTTTIGSFPQTQEIRSMRAGWREGTVSQGDYDRFLEQETAKAIRFQEDIGLDLLVHGEFERNDMVEYFGEQLAGFAFTENGWVQSYGSRCVKPPIIYGDVSRADPMTVRWSAYAQSLTRKPMKGMLTGPVTVLQWSFVRDDQPRSETAWQIALALRDEVEDLDRAGLAAIQIDEPALREGLPLRRAEWPAYLEWAVGAFRLTAAVARDETQIHTHMCYCEFNDIIDSIAALDADVISIEASRSNMELLEAFETYRYPAEVGPGVWDIHSPRVPSAEEMQRLLLRASAVLPAENIWVNPDCGLKTRGWAEVAPALANLVEAAHQMRKVRLTQPAAAAH